MENTATNNELVDEVLKLTLCCQEGDATEDECARLNVLLNDYPQARRTYLLACGDTITLVKTALTVLPEPMFARLYKLNKNALFSLAIAASLLVAVAWSITSTAGKQQDDSPLVTEFEHAELAGRIVNATNVKWSQGTNEFKVWSPIAVGEAINIEAGVVELMLENSTEIKLEGPAEFRLISLDRAKLNNGKLVARCGPEAVGFEVVSPNVKVVDLGTEFGVSVSEGRHTDVVVYDGEVDLSSRNGASPLERRLTAGEALHIPHKGESGRITEIRSDQYLTPRYPLDRAYGQSELILSVVDNLQSTETAKYYRVVHGGFVEDCRAYVDRHYEWNGVDETGLPPALVGGDFVMTFNDDKIRNIEIEIELAKPSTIYVLFDNRAPTPDWLANDFEDTGWDVGMDEESVPNNRTRTDLISDVGPGKSIDNVFSVWRQDISEAKSVKLGTIRNQSLDVVPQAVRESMYGIVITHLRDSERGSIF